VWQRPEAVHSEYFAMTLGYLSFTVGVALAFGHRYELLTRDLYVQRLALEHNREVIRRQREDLRVQVDERTRELRLLAGHLDRAAESERQRIARELHDDLGQSVSALRLSLATTLRRHARDPASIGANLDDLDELVGRIADGTRDAVTRLRPRILDDRGLVHAAEWLVRSTARHTGLDVSLDVRGDTAALEPGEGEVRAASPAATAAFRVLQEALNNAVRHAQARRIAVRLEASEGAVLLEVRDDGVGLGAKRDGGMGLITMRERARALGGELTVGPGERAGVVVACRLPLEAA
jgi:signal transduction histidine kinase